MTSCTTTKYEDDDDQVHNLTGLPTATIILHSTFLLPNVKQSNQKDLVKGSIIEDGRNFSCFLSSKAVTLPQFPADLCILNPLSYPYPWSHVYYIAMSSPFPDYSFYASAMAAVVMVISN